MEPEVSQSDQLPSMERLKSHAIPFFRRHIGELRIFFEQCRASSADSIPTLTLLQRFIRTKKMPFDMREYMNAQGEFIQNLLDESGESLTAEERQKIVSDWIKKYAEKLRNQAIEQQCAYLERESRWIVPQVEAMLREVFKKY